MKKETRISRLVGSLDHEPAARKAYLQLAGSGLLYLLTGLLLTAVFNSPTSAMPLLYMAGYILIPFVLPAIGIVAGLKTVAISFLIASPAITLLFFFASGMAFVVILMGIPMTTPFIALALQFFAIDGLRSRVGKFRALLLGGITGSVGMGLGIGLGHLLGITRPFS
ncbi:MAG TPA: hypothetical protein V6D46_03655 [Coleofasciculaceae cyanobacterium]